MAYTSSINNRNLNLMLNNCAVFLEEKEGGGQAQAACAYELITLPLVPAQIFMFSDLFSLGFLEEVAMFGVDLDH